MRKTLEITGATDYIPLEVSENNRKGKEDSKKKHQNYRMTDEEFEIWTEMLSFSRRFFWDMRFILGKETHPDWDSVFKEYKVRLWKQPRSYDQSIACVSHRSKTIWLRKNREDGELIASLLHEILHIYCRYIPASTSQLMAAVFYADKMRYDKYIKEILILETLADNPLIDDSEFVHHSSGELENLKEEKESHSSLFILESIKLDEALDLPLGSIYGYGRVKDFEELRKIADPNYIRENLRGN